MDLLRERSWSGTKMCQKAGEVITEIRRVKYLASSPSVAPETPHSVTNSSRSWNRG